MNKFKLDKTYLISLISSIVIALIIGGILMAVTGADPFVGYGAMLESVFGSGRMLGNTIAKGAQLCMTGLAMAVAAKAGMFNVGGEGQLYMGAMAAAMVGVWLTGLPTLVVLPLAFLAAAVAGGITAWLPAWLKVRLHVSEVITTIMFNSAIIFFCTWLVNGPFQTKEKGVLSATENVEQYEFFKLIEASNLTSSLIVSIIMAFLIWYVMGRTTVGLEMKITGENERFSFFAGMKKDRLMIWAMVASGAICGAVGMFEVYGVHGRYVQSISNQFYFDGMLVAMIMNYNPVGIIIMSLFFAVLKIGATSMELATGISSQISQIIFAIIIFLMAAQGGISKGIMSYIEKRKNKKAEGKEIGDGSINADI